MAKRLGSEPKCIKKKNYQNKRITYPLIKAPQSSALFKLFITITYSGTRVILKIGEGEVITRYS